MYIYFYLYSVFYSKTLLVVFFIYDLQQIDQIYSESSDMLRHTLCYHIVFRKCQSV